MASTPNCDVTTPQVYSAPYAAHVDAVPAKALAMDTTAVRPTGEWETGLFECFSVPAHCCMALFFPCVNGAYAAHGIGWSGFLTGLFFFVVYVGGVLFSISSQVFGVDGEIVFSYSNSSDGSTYWNVGSLICLLLFFAGVLVLRRQVRAFDRLPGSSFEDVCASFWCSCCVMSQLSAHTEKAKVKRSANAATLPAYQVV